MAEAALRFTEVEGKTLKELDQADLDEMLEAIQRIRFVARALWEMDEFDKVETGTISVMLNREADCIAQHMENIEERFDSREVSHV